MDGSRFDLWTRRSFGLAAGGLTGSVLALAGVEAKKKRKKKKKKCIKLFQECDPDGGKKCCDCLICGPVFNGVVSNECCLPGGSPCTLATQDQCCSKQCVGDFCLGKSNGETCLDSSQCLSFNCVANTCQPAG